MLRAAGAVDCDKGSLLIGNTCIFQYSASYGQEPCIKNKAIPNRQISSKRLHPVSELNTQITEDFLSCQAKVKKTGLNHELPLARNSLFALPRAP